MMQDPRKEARDYEKLSLKDRLKQYNSAKKPPSKEVTETGKPDFKAKFEAAMQKERDFVLNRAKQRDPDPDWYKKAAMMQKDLAGKENFMRFVKEVAEKKYLKPRKSF